MKPQPWPQPWPLVARTRDGAHYFVIAWVPVEEWPDPVREFGPAGPYAPVVVPRALYGKAARSTSEPTDDGGREDVYEAAPARPTILDLGAVDGWIGPPLSEP